MDKSAEQFGLLRDATQIMTDSVTEMINSVSSLLKNYDSEKISDVVAMDEEVSKQERYINDICVRILLLFEPKADDMRNVISTLNVAGELESIADYCVDIVDELKKQKGILPELAFKRLVKMTDDTASMVNDSIDAFYSKDAKLALEIIERDDRVDRHHNKIMKKAMESIKSVNEQAQGLVSLIFITRCLEKAADHAATISEHAYYKATGNVIKNVPVKDI